MPETAESDKSDPKNSHENLEQWWESEPGVTLTRSDWSVILETLAESASMDDLGDHIDQMAAKEKTRIIAEVEEQADIEPPASLTRAEYQEGSQ